MNIVSRLAVNAKKFMLENTHKKYRNERRAREECLTSSNKKLLVTGASLVVTSALLVGPGKCKHSSH